MSEIVLITKFGEKVCEPFEVNNADSPIPNDEVIEDMLGLSEFDK